MFDATRWYYQPWWVTMPKKKKTQKKNKLYVAVENGGSTSKIFISVKWENGCAFIHYGTLKLKYHCDP